MINLYNVSFLSCNVHLIQLYHDETFSLHCFIIYLPQLLGQINVCCIKEVSTQIHIPKFTSNSR